MEPKRFSSLFFQHFSVLELSMTEGRRATHTKEGATVHGVKVHDRRNIKKNKSSNKSYMFKSIGCHGIPKRKLTRIK
jgi:hypothetical protein